MPSSLPLPSGSRHDLRFEQKIGAVIHPDLDLKEFIVARLGAVSLKVMLVLPTSMTTTLV
ncbi:MAG: hypothetical protein WCE81_00385 [Halobacteriota archaeon]